MPMYKIRRINSDWYSHGVITDYGSHRDSNRYYIKFSSKGKIWTSEKTVKDHLLKCAKLGILDKDLEVIEVVYQPTKPIDDWIDAKMLVKIIKNQ